MVSQDFVLLDAITRCLLNSCSVRGFELHSMPALPALPANPPDRTSMRPEGCYCPHFIDEDVEARGRYARSCDQQIGRLTTTGTIDFLEMLIPGLSESHGGLFVFVLRKDLTR